MLRALLLAGLAAALAASAGGCLRADEANAPADRVELGDALFSNGWRWDDRRPELVTLEVDVNLVGPLAKTHVVLDVRNPSPYRTEFELRLPVPPSAAVTGAVLYTDAGPMPAAFVDKARAADVYRQIVRRRQDPLLVSWAGSELLSVSVFPFEAGQTRRLELDWVEPLAVRDGGLWYRVPVVGDSGELRGRPQRISVDGRRVGGPAREWLSLGQVPASTWEADGYRLVVPMENRASQAGVVLMLETSQAMRWSRNQHLETAHAVLAALPAHTRVTVLAVDWLVRAVAEDVTVSEARKALEGLADNPPAGALHPQRVLSLASQIADRVGAGVLIFIGEGDSAFAESSPAPAGALLANAGQTLLSVTGRTGDSHTWAPYAIALRGHGGGDGVARAVSAWLARVDGPVPPGRDGEEVLPFLSVTGRPVWIARARERREAASELGRAFAAVWARACAERGMEACDGPQVVSPETSLLALENDAQYATWGGGIDEPKVMPATLNDRAPSDAMDARLGRHVMSAGFLAAPPAFTRMPRAVRDSSRAREAYGHVRARLLREHGAALGSCLEQEGGRALRGADVLLRVSALGDVTRVGVPRVADSAASACLRTILRAWSFPPTGHGPTLVRVVLPSTGDVLVPGNAERDLKDLVRRGELDEAMQLEVARIYDFPYWADVEHLAWLVANSSEHRVAGFKEDRGWIGSWLTSLLAVRLLHSAGNEPDSQRVLSEIAPRCPALAVRVLASWGLANEARWIPPATRYDFGARWRWRHELVSDCAEVGELLQ